MHSRAWSILAILGGACTGEVEVDTAVQASEQASYSVLVVPVSFSDTSFYAVSPLDNAAELAAVFNGGGGGNPRIAQGARSIRDYWARNSQGRVDPIGVVVDPPIVIPHSKTYGQECNTNPPSSVWWALCSWLRDEILVISIELELIQRGIVPGNHAARVYLPAGGELLPSHQGITAPGRYVLMYQGSNSAYALGHELGHELGLHHSTYNVGTGYPYGDPIPTAGTDIMGYTGWELILFSITGDYAWFGMRDLNGAHRAQLGYVSSPSQIIDVPPGTSTWTLTATDQYPATEPQILRIQRAPDDYFYISLRHGAHLGAWLDGHVEITQGQQTTRYEIPLLGGSTFSATFHKAALAQGQTWCQDEQCLSRVTVDAVWIDGERRRARVTISR